MFHARFQPVALVFLAGAGAILSAQATLSGVPARALLLRHSEDKAAVLYTVPPAPPVVAGALIARDRPTFHPGESVGLAVLTETGRQPHWVWTQSAGTVQDLGGGRARFTVPADAAPGSVFRVTITATSTSSDAPPLRAFVDLTLE